jgi:hypothetical protein
MAPIKFKWAMVPAEPSKILALLYSLDLILFYVIFCMFQKLQQKKKKKLLSMQKFTLDNNAFMEFHPSCFFVKDRISRKILHKGSSKNGLFQ